MNLIKPAALKNLKFVPLDGTWYMPNSGKDALHDYQKERLPGARFFDLDGVITPSPYPHMMPSKSTFDSAMSKLGIKQSDTVVVYDKGNFFSSPRVYWMLKTFGHKDVYVLDNYTNYASSGDLEAGNPSTFTQTSYESPSVGKWVQFEEMEKLAADPSYVILDARPAGRFFGRDPEPRPGLPNGHIPGAISLPAGDVLENGHYKSSEAISQMLQDRGVDTSKQVIVMCGSGVTACIIKYAVDPLLRNEALVYDGSWTEWAQRSDKREA